MQQGPYGHPLVVTGQRHPGGWASGLLGESGLSIHLHEIGTPVTADRNDAQADIQVFFSGETEGAIPWGVGAWESLQKRVMEANGGGGRMLLRPHHRHVLADAPACRHWLFSKEPDPPACGVALSPASILVGSMVDAWEDHIGRLFEFIGDSSGAVILEDFHLSDSGEIQSVTMGSGRLDGGLVGSMIRTHVPSDVPVIIDAGSIDEAKSWLWPSSCDQDLSSGLQST